MAQYFIGERESCRFKATLSGGKVRVECIVRESWRGLLDDTIRCGVEGNYELKRTIGMKASEKTNLEASLKASAGITGLGELTAAAKAGMQSEVSFESSQEEVRHLKFSAPQCGIYHILQYQLVRTLEFRFDTDVWLGERRQTALVTEYTNCYHDGSRRVESDSNCGCKAPEQPDIVGSTLVDLGAGSFLAPIRATPEGLALEIMGNSFAVGALEHGDSFQLPSEFVPPSLKAMAGLNAESYLARVPGLSEHVNADTLRAPARMTLQASSGGDDS